MALLIELNEKGGGLVGVVVAGITTIELRADPEDAVNDEKTLITMADGTSFFVEEEYATVKTLINA